MTHTGRRPNVSTAPAPGVSSAADLATYDGPLLLDTHVWIWHLTGDATRLSAGTTALLDRCAAHWSLFVCDISYWEVAVKAAEGKLTFTVDVAVWLQRGEQAPGIRFRPLTRPVLLQSTRLEGSANTDPADRMLIAMAQLEGMPLVTADEQIITYARAHPGTPVVDARA